MRTSSGNKFLFAALFVVLAMTGGSKFYDLRTVL